MKIVISHIAELGSPIEWQACIDKALAEHGLEALPTHKLMLRYLVADALRRNLEATFGADKVGPVVDAILAELGTAPRERKQTIDRAGHVRRLSAMITLPPEAKQEGGSAVECLGVSDADLDAISKLVPNIDLRPHTSTITLMNAARDAASGRQVYLIDARHGMKPSSLKTLLSVLKIGQTILWVADPKSLALEKNDRRIVCDASVSPEDIAALLRIAFFAKF